MTSQENLQQDQDKSEHKDHWKNMSFHKAALVSNVNTTFTSVNTSLVVFCNHFTIRHPNCGMV